MSQTIRLTMAQALVRYLAAQFVEEDGVQVPLFAGCFTIFGHGNVAGFGEALYRYRDQFPTFRAHNEQGMAHAAIAYAKSKFRRRMMAVSTSIGPGATNVVTAAALAHVNRLPVLILPGDYFVNRLPDPVLQQVEDFGDGGVSANDCFKPVSRYFDRIVHPAQLLSALPRAIATLTDPVNCGPVTLALPQDIQATAYDYPEDFFAPRVIRFRAPLPEMTELEAAVATLKAAKRPMIISGGGVLYAKATEQLKRFADKHGIPVGETQAGKSALPWDHALLSGSVGVTGSTASNELAREADVILAVGTRLQDFTTSSNSLFTQAKVISLNVNPFDTVKWRAQEFLADAGLGLTAMSDWLGSWQADSAWTNKAKQLNQAWRETVLAITSRTEPPSADYLPYDGEVIGAVQRSANSTNTDIVVCAAGTLPAELHKLWRTSFPGGYHMEYGYSCMGYEIAGGLGAKMARPDKEVVVMVGDGSYLMMNSEIATSVMLDHKLIIVVQDNSGYGCISRLQVKSGSEPFNNMLRDCLVGQHGFPKVDFAKHAEALGAIAEHVPNIAGLEEALQRARAADRTYVIVIDTDDRRVTEAGGAWWEVGIPEVSESQRVRETRKEYDEIKRSQKK
ncbi:3D-(3,5/4)-trihydroxycyclohexane-1,2-dione acylhydrolase (decyclizing) [Leeia sp. TBRC 13508]|uniref:3D-(3,5/4)-trihydroxycyclohexane-1,2-dione acylhydrolase (Decyclizing) n=1 Tax=Leeia speluncae TaxID=2884804 RepID=A0ABS8DB40_9NEIS|nr:3D-(3,5/4)-trihydroxycyclohexane-1,2-dione acylhydrolase (decyclizing) [Leeia speluncae]MCB6185425.1 3D-(3,5/4)-trihydroxycyclohexane-1,2-dione acylhydrolase (decyclizing) [Leeia speluncae]